MRFRVRVYSHSTFEGLAHTIAIHKAVSENVLGSVIAEYLTGAAVRVVVEDEEDWARVEEDDDVG